MNPSQPLKTVILAGGLGTRLAEETVVKPKPMVPHIRHSHWMVSLLLDNSEVRQGLRAHLVEAGIETRPTFQPIHLLPPYTVRYRRHPVSEELARRGLNLPSYPALNREDVMEICASIRTFFETRS